MENIFATFLQTAGLYDSKEICEDNIADLIELLKGNVKISAYCKECKQERVFHMKPIVVIILKRVQRGMKKLGVHLLARK